MRKEKKDKPAYILHLHTTYYPTTQGSEVSSKICTQTHFTSILYRYKAIKSYLIIIRSRLAVFPVSSLFTSPQQSYSLPPASSLENKNKGRTWPNPELSLPLLDMAHLYLELSIRPEPVGSQPLLMALMPKMEGLLAVLTSL